MPKRGARPPIDENGPGHSFGLLGFDPVNNPAALADFRNAYHLDPSVPIVGPWNS
jgi:hypothetical protein